MRSRFDPSQRSGSHVSGWRVRHPTRRTILAMAVLALSCCRAMVPDDLQVTNVQCFSDREGMPISDLPLPGAYPQGGAQSVFRVTVRTTKNLTAYVRRKDFNPGVSVFPCDDPKSSLQPSGPDYGDRDPSKDVTDDHGFHQYHFYFYSSDYFPAKTMRSAGRLMILPNSQSMCASISPEATRPVLAIDRTSA